MNIKQVYPDIGSIELDYLSSSINNKWLTEGPLCKKFISKMKSITKAKYAVLAPNGTLGLYLGLLALNLKPNSEVIIPSFTFYASAMAVYFAGLKPVFVDVDPDNYNINIEKTKKLINKNTSAIMPVHVYGQSADMTALNNLCKENKIKIIEDAAQGCGVHFKGKHTGTIGDVGVISFFADKTITMGEGAIILTNNKKTFERLNLLRNQGRPNSGTFKHPSLGMNFRITDLQAGIGCAQLDKISQIIDSRKKNHEIYIQQLGECEKLTLHKPTPGSEYIPFRLALTSKFKNKIMANLENAGVQTRSFFYPMHLQPQLKKYKRNTDMSISEKLFNTGVCLPIHNNLNEKQIKRISKIVLSSFK